MRIVIEWAGDPEELQGALEFLACALDRAAGDAGDVADIADEVGLDGDGERECEIAHQLANMLVGFEREPCDPDDELPAHVAEIAGLLGVRVEAVEA